MHLYFGFQMKRAETVCARAADTSNPFVINMVRCRLGITFEV